MYERTRALYSAQDKAGLLSLAENEYTECIARVEKFHRAFRKQWYTVNKTYGFEVQDTRLGGLIQRLKSCRDRLLDYANGVIISIDELEENTEKYPDGNVPYVKTVSANIM